MSKKDLSEIGATKSSARKDEHQILIQKLEKGGYTIASQEENEETGLDQELVSHSIETVLSPPKSAMPHIKLEAKEIFGYYDYEHQTFEKLDSPKFEFSAYKKGAELHNAHDQWDKFDLS